MIRPHWHKMLLLVLLGIVTSPLPVLMPRVGKVIIDNVLLNVAAPMGDRIANFLGLTLVIILLEQVYNLVNGGWFEGYALNPFLGLYMTTKIRLSLRKRLYRHLHRLPMSFFQRRPIGEHAYRVMSDTGPAGIFGPDAVTLATALVPGIVNVFNQTALAIGYLAVVTPDLALLVACYVFPKVFFLHFLTTFVQRQTFRARRWEQGRVAVLRESIAGAQTSKSLGQEKHEARRFARALVLALRQSIGVFWWGLLAQQVQTVLELLFGVGLWAFVAWKTIQGEYTLGDFVSIQVIVRGIPVPLVYAVQFIQEMRMNLVLGERILQTLDVSPDNVDKPNAVRLPKVQGRIELDHVRFSYPDGTRVLEDVSLSIEPGESVAVVGPSGQGKTTLLYLVLRIYRPTGGVVRIDGIDLNDLCLGDLVKNSGIVMQETHLFVGRVWDNLKYPWPLAKERDIVEAARIADIDDFIMSLPDGFQTDLREGQRMSGGQRQRLGIARALVGRPQILLFDEPTSNLDSRTETEVWGAMRNAMRGRTSLMVTHRLPTARTADRIALLNNGVIAETGTHDELMALNGLYARMWNEQFHSRGEVGE